jgi:hypothetical protein
MKKRYMQNLEKWLKLFGQEHKAYINKILININICIGELKYERINETAIL